MRGLKTHKEKRPWGEFEKFIENKRCTVKILKIKKNEALSLQYHIKREEFWKVIKGNAIVIVGNKKYFAKEGDRFFIPRRSKHRIIGKKSDAWILEISLGYFDEKDEIRLEDKYNRTK